MDKYREIAAGEFKTNCLKLMEVVKKTRIPIIITKHGKPIAKLVAVEGEDVQFFGCMKGAMLITGDIISPIDVEWETNV